MHIFDFFLLDHLPSAIFLSFAVGVLADLPSFCDVLILVPSVFSYEPLILLQSLLPNLY